MRLAGRRIPRLVYNRRKQLEKRKERAECHVVKLKSELG